MSDLFREAHNAIGSSGSYNLKADYPMVIANPTKRGRPAPM